MTRRYADGDPRIAYELSGSGPVAIFPTPGWGPSSELYSMTMGPLEERFTVAYTDTRGCGDSALPSDDDWSMDAIAADLDRVRRSVGEERVWVVGHSMGGFLAQRYALAFPDRCAGLLLLDTYAAMDDDMTTEIDVRRARRSHEPWYPTAVAALESGEPATDDQLTGLLEAILPLYFHDVAAMDRVKEAFTATTFTGDAYVGIYSQNAKHSVLDRLHEIRCPTVVVVGDDDFVCSPRQAMRVHNGIRGSKLVLIEAAGHFPWVEQPDAFYAGVDAALVAACR